MPRNFNYAFQNRLTFFLASMRPRQMPRNFHLCFNYSKFSLCCFNEAAADAAEFLRPSLREKAWVIALQ